ncbi:MAG: RNA polymerase sigma factor [Opitutaceae bacterium]|nr:RNA polymerase sigma factor [Opitutaceae bacterium]
MSPPPPPPQLSPSVDQSRWFAEEVHPHDASLKSYLRGAFPTVGDIDDVVQESYLRIWKARAAQPIQFAKAFLFKVARNVAINVLQHERVSPIYAVADLASLPVIEDRPSAAEAACTREEILLLADGIEALPARCREIFILRRIKAVSQREIAARLGISEQTVQVQVQRGVKRCEEFLRRRGVERSQTDAEKP